MRLFGSTIEAMGGFDTMDQGLLAEMMAFAITKNQEERRQQDELAAVLMATGV